MQCLHHSNLIYISNLIGFYIIVSKLRADLFMAIPVWEDYSHMNQHRFLLYTVIICELKNWRVEKKTTVLVEKLHVESM